MSRLFNVRGGHTLAVYREYEGYLAWTKCLTMEPAAVIDLVKQSQLRGRGGAGFPTGMKWGFVPQNIPKPKYLVCNADESEPGTFKDKQLLEFDPHGTIEGMLIASFAIRAQRSYIYIRGEFYKAARIIERAIEEARAAGFIGKNILGLGFDHEMTVYRGAGAYICGEETALLESLEGKRGHPRIKPPFPAVVGAFGCPTVVNNVETLACLPHIVNRGADWFKSIGTEKGKGPKLYCISGHVKRPGVYELPMGTPLREIIYEHAGGIRDDKALKAVVPGGASAAILTPDQIDVPMDFDGVAAIGSMLGSAGIVVFDETTCIVDAVLNLAKFFAHESCGQCTPCREGTPWMKQILARIEHGKGMEKDLELLVDIANHIGGGTTICPFGDAAIAPVLSSMKKFRPEFEHHVKTGRCLVERTPVLAAH